jgi:hypothetical protein
MSGTVQQPIGIDLQPGMVVRFDEQSQLHITIPMSRKRRRLEISAASPQDDVPDKKKDDDDAESSLWEEGNLKDPCVFGPMSSSGKKKDWYYYCHTSIPGSSRAVVLAKDQHVRLAFAEREGGPQHKGVGVIHHFTIDETSQTVSIHGFWYYSRKEIISLFKHKEPTIQDRLDEMGAFDGMSIRSEHKFEEKIDAVIEVLRNDQLMVAPSCSYTNGDLISTDKVPIAIESSLTFEEQRFRDFICSSREFMFMTTWGRQVLPIIDYWNQYGMGQMNLPIKKLLINEDNTLTGCQFQFDAIPKEDIKENICGLCRYKRPLTWKLSILHNKEEAKSVGNAGSCCKNKLERVQLLLRYIFECREWFKNVNLPNTHLSLMPSLHTRYSHAKELLGFANRDFEQEDAELNRKELLMMNDDIEVPGGEKDNNVVVKTSRRRLHLVQDSS